MWLMTVPAGETMTPTAKTPSLDVAMVSSRHGLVSGLFSTHKSGIRLGKDHLSV
jgi:hypothetical protein